MASRVIKHLVNGRLVVCRPRRTEYEVDVYSGTEEVGEPLESWGMPKVLGIAMAMRQAEAQTDRMPKER